MDEPSDKVYATISISKVVLMIKHWLPVFIFSVSFLLSACQLLPSGWQEFPAIVLTEQATRPLFQDDFSSSKSRWLESQDQHGTRQYKDGVFQIQVNSSWMNTWSFPQGLSFEDVRIDVKAQRVSGVKNNMFGILCRYQNEENFYQILVSSDGYYDISKVADGVRIPLIGEQLLPSEAIPQDSDLLFLSAVCQGDQIELMVNGSLISRVIDSDFQKGNVGLIAGAFEQGGVEIHFDDLSVWIP